MLNSADALAAFAAARVRMPPSPPLPGPFTARATALPGTLIWHASTSESHSTSALHSTHQLAWRHMPRQLHTVLPNHIRGWYGGGRKSF